MLPQDIAESIAFLSSSKAAKTTGCMEQLENGEVDVEEALALLKNKDRSGE